VPERRQVKEEAEEKKAAGGTAGEITVWRCKVCGYLCAREGPPEVCPICKAQRDRFEMFLFP